MDKRELKTTNIPPDTVYERRTQIYCFDFRSKLINMEKSIQINAANRTIFNSTVLFFRSVYYIELRTIFCTIFSISILYVQFFNKFLFSLGHFYQNLAKIKKI